MTLNERSLDKDKREIHLSKDLAVIFGPAYELLNNSLKEVVKDSPKIVDIGCSDGKIEDLIDEMGYKNEVVGLDVNQKALDELNIKQYKSIKLETVCTDGNDFLKKLEEKIDLLIINNTLHELNTPEDQGKYLDEFFEKLDGILKPSGKAVLADHYYNPDLSDEEVNIFMAEQFKKIHHADARNKFILPEILKQKIEEHNYSIIKYDEVRVTQEIDKRYYIFIISK